MCTGKGNFVFLVIGVLWGVCVGETRLLCPGWAAPLAQGNWERHIRSGPFEVLNFLPQQRL